MLDNNIPMLNLSLLYPVKALKQESIVNLNPEVLKDLCIDEICDGVFKGNDYLRKIFVKELLKPCTSSVAIRQRQEILRDFCNDENLLSHLIQLCKDVYESDVVREMNFIIRNGLPSDTNARYAALVKGLDKLSDLLEQQINIIYSSKNVSSFSKCTVTSGVLAKLIEYLTDDKYQGNFRKIIAICRSLLSKGGYECSVKFANGLKLQSVQLDKKTGELYIPKREEKKFIKVHEITDESRLINVDVNENFILVLNVKEVMVKTLLKVYSFLMQIITSLNRFFYDLLYELDFYKASLMLMKFYQENGLSYCMPDVIGEDEGATRFCGLYDLSLAARFINEGGKENLSLIVSNDLDIADGKILIITGANQGGKTTFLRSLGIAQLFMQSGVYVAAKTFASSPAAYIATHFPKEEDSGLEAGKLEEELIRLRRIFENAKKNSFILFNEPFTTTTVKEGSRMAADTIKALSYTGSRVAFVTHFYEFAVSMCNQKEELFNGERAISLVTEFPKGVQSSEYKRTYKIVRGEPQKRVYADEIAKQYTRLS